MEKNLPANGGEARDPSLSQEDSMKEEMLIDIFQTPRSVSVTE